MTFLGNLESRYQDTEHSHHVLNLLQGSSKSVPATAPTSPKAISFHKLILLVLELQIRRIKPYMLFFVWLLSVSILFLFFKHLFIWLHWSLVAALRIFNLHCGLQNLQLWYVESSSLTKDQTQDPLHWEHGTLATGPPGKSNYHPVLEVHSRYCLWRCSSPFCC